jgi:hypothetical protein
MRVAVNSFKINTILVKHYFAARFTGYGAIWGIFPLTATVVH